MFVPEHEPFTQVSFWVQALPSLQALPFGLSGLVHWPVCGSQTPATWHWSSAAQTTGLPPTHAPFWQASPVVQGLPSLQALPFALLGFEHTPVAGSHAPGAWH